jgi:hypothetical protein
VLVYVCEISSDEWRISDSMIEAYLGLLSKNNFNVLVKILLMMKEEKHLARRVPRLYMQNPRRWLDPGQF